MSIDRCKNCHTELAGKFCHECGQKAKTERINFKHLWEEVSAVFLHANRGFLFTIKELLIRPGKAIKDYLRGKRVMYYKPFLFLFFLVTVYFIQENLIKKYLVQSDKPEVEFNINDSSDLIKKIKKDINTQSNETDSINIFQNVDDGLNIGKRKVSQEKVGHFFENIIKWSQRNKAITILIFMPLIAFAFWLSFFSYHKYNYAEFLIITFFVSAQTTIIDIIGNFIELLVPYFNQISFWISIAYLLYTFIQIFSFKKKRYVILRTFLFFLLFFFLFFLTITSMMLVSAWVFST